MASASVMIQYSCPDCGIKDRAVSVTARGNEDVVRWLENTCIVELSRDHAAISPLCHPEELKDIRIPLSGADKIGGVVKQ